MHSRAWRRPRRPWASTKCSRRRIRRGKTPTPSDFIGSVQRECLDHVIVFTATGLQRLMNLYCAYYERSWTHLSLNKDASIPRPVAVSRDHRVVATHRSAAFITGTNAARPDSATRTDVQPMLAQEARIDEQHCCRRSVTSEAASASISLAEQNASSPKACLTPEAARFSNW
jgi:hypothetical protein